MLPHTPRKLRLALVSGGRSGEHEISIRSAESVKEALDPTRYELIDYFIDPDGRWHPHPISADFGGNPGIDVVFPVLHGTFGEDGTVQGLLELAGLPYVGSGVMASAVAMDKAVTKRLCREAGLPVVEYVVLERNARPNAPVELPFEYPVFVKPANLGSSVGISKVHSAASLEMAIATAAQFDRKIIIERGVKGREFECAVLDGEAIRASTPCEVIPSEEFYSYEQKYILDTARIDLPAQLSQPKMAEMQRLAVAAFEAVGCEGMARVDFLMDGASEQLYVNEVNTIPGFTSISMYPKMWAHSGIAFPELIEQLIQLALQRAEQKRRTRFSRQ